MVIADIIYVVIMTSALKSNCGSFEVVKINVHRHTSKFSEEMELERFVALFLILLQHSLPKIL